MNQNVFDKTQNLQTPVQYLKGVGPRAAKLLAKLGVETVADLLFYFPREYEDRRNVLSVGAIKKPADNILIKGEIEHIEHQKFSGRFSVVKPTLRDKTGRIKIVFFNQPYLLKLFRVGMKMIVSGKAEINQYEGGLQIIPRDWEIDTGDLPPIMPVYGLTEGIYAKYLRKIIRTAIDSYLDCIPDPLPADIMAKYKFADLKECIRTLHFPSDFGVIDSARKRIIFEDFFIFQLSLGLRRKEIKEAKGIPFRIDEYKDFSLPFKLTSDQEKVLHEILKDMAKDKPMSRLLQGDVGCGKTIIAAISAFIAIKNGCQAAVMAPTEILAEQHYQKIIGLSGYRDIRIKLLTGTTQRKDKIQQISDAQLIIGTHALIEEKVEFRKLGLVIIDEQHRFGVLQRSLLSQKGINPDLLFMTATPIPRSLALTLYGDLDRSVISEMPPGRQPVKTHFVSGSKRKGAYEFIRNKIKEGRQAFVVCPLVSESEVFDLKAAEKEARNLQEDVFPEFKVGLVHGRMKQPEKDKIMRDFRNKKVHVLVATTVIEVGIDIPAASVMVIEHAERFGLSQLHQLRGRVGRGESESFCFLMGNPKSDDAKIRIKAMLESSDGFKIAEVDLRMRGPGDFCGVKQSGLPKFRMADIIRDENILLQAREEAFNFLKGDPECALLRDLQKEERLKFLKAA